MFKKRGLAYFFSLLFRTFRVHHILGVIFTLFSIRTFASVRLRTVLLWLLCSLAIDRYHWTSRVFCSLLVQSNPILTSTQRNGSIRRQNGSPGIGIWPLPCRVIIYKTTTNYAHFFNNWNIITKICQRLNMKQKERRQREWRKESSCWRKAIKKPPENGTI